MKDHIKRVASHDFLSSDQTEQRLAVLKRRNIAAAVATTVTFILLMIAEDSSHRAVVVGPVIIFSSHLVFVLIVVVFWWCAEAFRKLQYNAAPGSELEKVRPLLSDPGVSEIVSSWIRQRPLQNRDVQVLLDSLPSWRLARDAETFASSLEGPTSPNSGKESAP